jgi:MoaA/NifB/PqqE/SkfB family radical SAM enzyme
MYFDGMGLMITERCNFHCDHCMFSCGPHGKNMSLKVAQARLFYPAE